MRLPAVRALKARVRADCWSGPWSATAFGRWSDIRAWMSVGDGERDDVREVDRFAISPGGGAEDMNGCSIGGSTARASSRPRPRGLLLPIVMRADGNAEGFRSQLLVRRRNREQRKRFWIS